MTKPRKKWATQYAIPGAPRRQHTSAKALWEYIAAERALWKTGALRTSRLTVFVDEGDRRGWLTYERVDLADGEIEES